MAPGYTLRIKVLPNKGKLDPFLELVGKAAEQWLKASQDGLTLQIQWVEEDEPAEIRISSRADQPNWSCVGARAVGYDQSSATMNFSFGTWKDDRTIYTHNHVAADSSALAWDRQKLTTMFGDAIASRMADESGYSELRRSDSIMRFDRPATLTSGNGDRRGGSSLDEEARSALQKLYPPWFDVLLISQEAASVSGFEEGGASGRIELATRFTNGPVMGFSRLDINSDANFRVASNIAATSAGSSLNIAQGSWGDTVLHDCISSVLSFAENDRRFQTGLTSISQDEGYTGSLPDEDVTFPRPFRTVPQVVTFISGFDTEQGKRIRLKTYAKNITQNGFTISKNTWDDSKVFLFKVSWIAHESDDPSVRSGQFLFSEHPDLIESESVQVSYSSPMKKKPRYVFTALSLIDVGPDNTIRLACDINYWDDKMIEGHCFTWEQESHFFKLCSVYVAIL